jgi:hypothetical protein
MTDANLPQSRPSSPDVPAVKADAYDALSNAITDLGDTIRGYILAVNDRKARDDAMFSNLSAGLQTDLEASKSLSQQDKAKFEADIAKLTAEHTAASDQSRIKLADLEQKAAAEQTGSTANIQKLKADLSASLGNAETLTQQLKAKSREVEAFTDRINNIKTTVGNKRKKVEDPSSSYSAESDDWGLPGDLSTAEVYPQGVDAFGDAPPSTDLGSHGGRRRRRRTKRRRKKHGGKKTRKRVRRKKKTTKHRRKRKGRRGTLKRKR